MDGGFREGWWKFLNSYIIQFRAADVGAERIYLPRPRHTPSHYNHYSSCLGLTTYY